MSSEKSNSITSSMIYKTLERYSVLGISLVVQIVIARILEPEQFGLISMMTVFISIATVFIQNGFNMALIQIKKADENDYSTAFWINTAIGISLYCVIFFVAPYISSYYGEPAITNSLRVLALILVIGSTESIQIAIASRKMQFKKIFISNLASGIVSGIVGILAALLGAGVWAIVFQQLVHKFVIIIVLGIALSWKPRFIIKKESAIQMFSFGWKMLAAGLVNAVYQELNSLLIGKKYSSDDLAYYSKGKQFPNYVATGIDSSIQSVMLSAFSKKQNDKKILCNMLRTTISVNAYVIFPMMLGLALIAEPLTILLLTEKWLPIVPYMQICCITFALHPIDSAHLQALAAIGRSDMRLKLEFIKKPIGMLLLFVALNYGPFAIAVSAVIASVISMLVAVISSRVYIGLSIKKQIMDIGIITLITVLMGIGVYCIGKLSIPIFWSLLSQIAVGGVLYIALSAIFKPTGYKYICNLLTRIIKKGR